MVDVYQANTLTLFSTVHGRNIRVKQCLPTVVSPQRCPGRSLTICTCSIIICYFSSYTHSLLSSAAAAQTARMVEACHNCRRQRLKCDRTLPHCLKCTKRGQECLGYGRLYRWELGVASRGKMTGVSLDQKAKVAGASRPPQHHTLVPAGSTEPLLQDMSIENRRYLSYCK